MVKMAKTRAAIKAAHQTATVNGKLDGERIHQEIPPVISNDVKKMSKVVVEKVHGLANLVENPLVFSKDSKFVFIPSGCSVEVYSVESGDKIHSLRKHRSAIVGIAVKDEDTLFSCDKSGKVFEWDIKTGEFLKERNVRIPARNNYRYFNYLGDDKFLVSVMSPNGNKDSDLWMVKFGSEKGQKLIFSKILKDPKFIAFGCRGNDSLVITALKENSVVIHDVNNGIDRKHMVGGRKITCIAVHPEEPIMATGDAGGRIVVWHDFIFTKKVAKTYYNWHVLPVNSLCFSSEGEYLFSGGAENVLVKWQLKSARKEFLPRMTSAIQHIVKSPNNLIIATLHVDNAIRFISTTNEIVRAIIGMVMHQPIRGLESSESLKESVLPIGLVWNPQNGTIFLNAQAGNLQLMDPNTNSMLFNIDIANRNILTDNPNKEIGNAEILRAAVSSNGQWLATLENWSSMSVGFIDMKLKIWKFEPSHKNYILNTEVATPHNGRITALAFQPGFLGNEWPCLVSIGQDLKFKMWRLAEDADGNRRKTWTCDVAGDFRNLMPTALSFSEDGSLLAIAFQDIVTLWDPSVASVSATLAHPAVQEPIELMEFGGDHCFRYLVCASKKSLFTWDVIGQQLVWKVGLLPSPINCLIRDPKSSYMAIILKSSQVYIFSPSSSTPVHSHEDRRSVEPIAAIFVPRPNPIACDEKWLVNSRLLIVDANQEFSWMDDSSTTTAHQRPATHVSSIDSLPWTPFAAIKAQKQISAAKQLVPVIHQTSGIKGYDSVHKLLETSACALPPMSRICNSFLSCLLIKHDATVLQTKSESGKRLNISPLLQNGSTSAPEMVDEELLQKLRKLDCKWLLNDVCD